MTKLILSTLGSTTGVIDYNPVTNKFLIQIAVASNTALPPPSPSNVYTFGGTYEFTWGDSLESIYEGLINLAVTNAALVGLTVSTSDVQFLNWRIIG